MTKRARTQKKTPPEKAKPSPSAITLSNSTPTLDTDAAEAKEQQQPTERPTQQPSRLDVWTCRATVAIAIATAIYTFTAIWQLSVLSSQLSQMREASRADSAAWNQQLEVMQGQLAQMQESSHLEQRAWVGVSSATHDPIEPNAIRGKFVFTNTGRTPATIVAIGRLIHSMPATTIDIAATAKEWESTTSSLDKPTQRCLAPGASMTYNFSTNPEPPLSEAAIVAIKSGKVRICVLGKLVYEDAFRAEHITTFCGMIKPDDSAMSMSDAYNYMD